MTGQIDLDGRTWEAPTAVSTRSVVGVMARADLIQRLGPSGLLALGAVAGTTARADATSKLRDEFGFSLDRARAAVNLAALLSPDAAANQPVGYIAGTKINQGQAAYLARLVAPVQDENVRDAPDVSHAHASRAWGLGRVRPLATAAVRSGDSSVGLVAAALLAAHQARGELVLHLTEAQFHTLAGRGTRLRRNIGRVLGAAYAITAVGKEGLDLGHRCVDMGSANWRMRAAPWVLPILDETNGSSVQALLEAVDKRQLEFVEPGVNPLPYPDDAATLRDTLTAATAYSNRLTKWTDRPMWFDGGPGGAQVLLTQDEVYMYAWVGTNGEGVLVAFDTVDLVGYGLDEPGVRAALAHALGWFVDVSISLRKTPTGTTTVRRGGSSSKVSGHRYVPTPVYTNQVKAVATRQSRPPRITAVQSHLRQLKKRKPSAAARARAPRRLRDLMGPKDTFVRGHIRGNQAAGILETRLSQHSMLADVIGRHQVGQSAP